MDLIKVERDLDDAAYPICLLKEEQVDVKCEEYHDPNSFSLIVKEEPLDFSEDCDTVTPVEPKFCAHGFAIHHLQYGANNIEEFSEETTERRLKCEVCGVCSSEVLCSESLKIHVPTGREEKPSAEFPQCENLENHSDSGENSFICDVCGTSFTQLIYLNTHKCTHVQEKHFNSEIIRCISADIEESPIECNTKKNIFPDTYKLDTHTDSHTGKSDSLKHHIRTRTGKKTFKCNICGKTFSQTGHLTHHIRIHTGEKPFMCDICAKAFSDKSKLKRHVLTHTGEKAFKCNICGKGFSQKAGLKRHIRSHTGEKAFKCDICGKEFSQRGGLKHHILTHNGEKPFKCDVCERRFSKKGSLKHHMVTHTGEKPCKCDICGKSFALSGNLTQHMATHSREKRFKCIVCGKGFSLSGALNRHILTHTGKKHFKCDICAKAFWQLERLRHHMVTHKGFQT